MNSNMPANIVVAASSAIALLQSVVPPMAPTDFLGPVERLTLVGALVVAVRVLWIANKAKDLQITTMSVDVTKTMVLVMEAVKELRIATEEVGAAMDNVAENVAALTPGRSSHGRD